MLERMNILTTSGGTREFIDDVRVLTNISTGKLGTLISYELGCRFRVQFRHIHLRGTGYEIPTHFNVLDVETTNVKSLIDSVEKFVPDSKFVIHSMAVSDFSFDRKKPIKLKSDDPEAFIEFLRQSIVKTPKVIQKIKEINPDCVLFGFKFEVGKTHDELLEIAKESMIKSNSDYVFANDKAEMDREGDHIGYLIDREGNVQRFKSKVKIAIGIADVVEKISKERLGIEPSK